MGSLEKNLKRNNIAPNHSQPCEVMNKTDLKERISLSEKFPLIKIVGGWGRTGETTNKLKVHQRSMSERSVTSKMDNGDLALSNPPGQARTPCCVGWLRGAVLSGASGIPSQPLDRLVFPILRLALKETFQNDKCRQHFSL